MAGTAAVHVENRCAASRPHVFRFCGEHDTVPEEETGLLLRCVWLAVVWLWLQGFLVTAPGLFAVVGNGWSAAGGSAVQCPWCMGRSVVGLGVIVLSAWKLRLCAGY